MGSGGGNMKSTSNTVAEPWQGQKPYLKEAFAEAQRLYQEPGPEIYQGRVTPEINRSVQQSQDLARNYITQSFNPMYSQLKATAGQNLNANYLNDLQRQTYGQLPATLQAGINNYYGQEGQLASGINPYLKQGATQTPLNQMQSYGNLDVLANQGLFGNQGYWAAQPYLDTGASLTDINSNPVIQQMGDAATRDIVRQYQEQILPGISQDAIGAGQFGGSRQGIAEGIAARGAQQNIADAIANLYGGAYGQGLQAQTQRQGQSLGFLQGIQGQTQDAQVRAALGLSGAETEAARNAIAGSQNLANFGLGLGQLAGERYATNVGTQADILGGINENTLRQMLGYGALMPEITKLGLTPASIYEGIGTYQEGRQQSELDAAISRFQQEQMQPYEKLAQYYGIIGSNQAGGTTTTSSEAPGRSATSRVIGGASGALGGAAAGAAVGSVVPGIGTVLGAVVGGILGGAGGAAM